MRKRLLSFAMVLCLCLALLPGAALADPEYQYAEPIDVSDAAALLTALPEGESEPDGNNIVWIPVARMTADIALTDPQNELHTLGKLIIPAGVTLTIGEGVTAEAEFCVEEGGTIDVLPGGDLAATMAGETAIVNYGTINVAPDARIESQKGGHLVNCGALNLEGEYICRGYADEPHDFEPILWFENSGTISGGGQIVLADLVVFSDTVGYEDVIDQAKAKLLAVPGVAEDIRYCVRTEREVCNQDELREALEGEPMDENFFYDRRAVLACNIEVTEDIDAAGCIVVPEDCVLAVAYGAMLSAGIEVRDGGSLVVNEGSAVYTNMFGDLRIEQGGSVYVGMDAGIVTQQGGEIFNEGSIVLDGMIVLRGYTEPEDPGVVRLWLHNEGGVIEGGGQIILVEVFQFGDNPPSYMDSMLTGNAILCGMGGIEPSVARYVRARDFEEIKALAADGSVEGIYVRSEDNPEDMVITGEREDVEIVITEDLDLTGKELCIEYPDVSVGAGATVTIGSLEDDLHFMRLFVGRLLVDAGGGTIVMDGQSVISGDGGAGAILTPTEGYMWIGMAQWGEAVPSTWGSEWYYCHETSSIDAAGTLPEALALPLLVDGTLNITGSFIHPGSVEIRDAITLGEGAQQGIANLNFGVDSVESALCGTESTTYELNFDLNTGSGYVDFYDHLQIRDGKIYLDQDWFVIPETPEREGYTFAGWKATSTWSAATPEALAAFTLESDEDGVYVREATAFPVVMVAQWTPDQSEWDGEEDADAPAPTAEATIATVAEDGSVAVTVSADDAKTGTAVLPVEITAGKNAEEAPVITVALPENAGEVTLEIPVADVNASTVAVLVHPDGSEEVLPDTALTETGIAVTLSEGAALKVVNNEKSFADVTKEGWKKEAVTFVAARGLFLGVGIGTNFAPEETMDRAMIATVLYRLARAPESGSGAAFSDVKAGKWYSEAIAWASETGIMQGYGESFGTEKPVTREELVTMLWRLSGKPAAATKTVTGASDWAAEAMSWAVSVGLLQGDGSGNYNAKGSATRAETAAFLMRFINL